MSIETTSLVNDIVTDMAIDRTKRIWGDSAIKAAIKEALKELQSRCFYRLECNSGDVTIETVDEKRSYCLDNFPGLEDIHNIYIDGQKIAPISKDETILRGEDQEGRPQFYYVENGHINLYPVPNDDYELRVTHSKILYLSDEDSEIDIDENKYKEFLKLYSAYYLFLGKSDVANQQRAAAKKLLWQPMIARIIGAYAMNNASADFGVRGGYVPRLSRKSRR